MYTLNDTCNLYLKCVKCGDSIEFKASRKENPIEGILSKGIHYNWIAFPSLHLSCQLADFNDIFWNAEQLNDLFDNPFDADTVLMVISELKDLFEQDCQTYFDGHRFMSKSEYIFWLENECEILSVQLDKLQLAAQEVLDDDFADTLQKEKNDYHNSMRFQYDDTIFE